MQEYNEGLRTLTLLSRFIYINPDIDAEEKSTGNTVKVSARDILSKALLYCGYTKQSAVDSIRLEQEIKKLKEENTKLVDRIVALEKKAKDFDSDLDHFEKTVESIQSFKKNQHNHQRHLQSVPKQQQQNNNTTTSTQAPNQRPEPPV